MASVRRCRRSGYAGIVAAMLLATPVGSIAQQRPLLGRAGPYDVSLRVPAPGPSRVGVPRPGPGDYRLGLTAAPKEGCVMPVTFTLRVGGPSPGDAGMPMGHGAMEGMAGMPMGFAGIPATRGASGTAWQPDSTPTHAYHRMAGRWSLMQHYNLLVDYDRQGGPRGGEQLNSLNWWMGMARRQIGRAELMARLMLSLDPATATPRGYPLLYQSGESYGGHPLVDRQHPHDLLMETATRLRYAVRPDTALSLYAALSGEPALGPPGFPHRLSAMDTPPAPISHHWQDSTHITFGVLTAGVAHRNVQVEGSAFTGREPDEHRWNLDPIHIDSFAGRVTFNPGRDWSLQASYGYLHSPEALHPEEDVRRTTFSAMHNRPLAHGGNWASTFVWGCNRQRGANSDSLLLESTMNLARRSTLLGRLEWVNKLGEELDVKPPEHKLGITQLTLGGLHELTPGRSYETGVGAAITFNWAPRELDRLYGRSPVGFWLFLRIRPAPMRHGM
ncbi:MAG: hypothetical protein IT208_16800 [Chthonomonadales bacterium]|nr:hypothetical protein [Chthonomonadales bacterium]